MTYGRLRSIALFGILLFGSTTRAERVGYQFSGRLLGPDANLIQLFGVGVPRNAMLTGAFSYDTTAVGIDAEPGVRTFAQSISGGFTLNIADSAIRLAASDYTITVANDFGPSVSDVFTVGYNFDGSRDENPAAIFVNDSVWTGNRAFLNISLSWEGDTFADPDEPKLTGDRPGTPLPSVFAGVGDAPSPPRFFSAMSFAAIAPISGDYNRDGRRDARDFAEWRSVFGQSASEYSYADGDGSGTVDAADYVVWRKLSATSAHIVATPEPGTLTLLVFMLLPMVGRKWP